MKNQKGSSWLEVIIGLVFICIILLAGKVFGYVGCQSYSSNTDRSVKYSLLSGCYVKTQQGWIPKDEIGERVMSESVPKDD